MKSPAVQEFEERQRLQLENEGLRAEIERLRAALQAAERFLASLLEDPEDETPNPILDTIRAALADKEGK